MSSDLGDIETPAGGVALAYPAWRAVINALDGDESCRDTAFDALQRWAPQTWLDELERQA